MLTLFDKISKLKIREGNIHSKSIVIELYSPDENCQAAIKRELAANYEIGNEFRKKVQQVTRFIYALNDEIDKEIDDSSVINVADEQGLLAFLREIKSGDSLIIVAQGDINTQTVAGCSADEFVEILHEDLELDLNTLKSVELFAGNMSDCEPFRKKLADSCKILEQIIACKPTSKANSKGAFFFAEASESLEEESENCTTNSNRYA